MSRCRAPFRQSERGPLEEKVLGISKYGLVGLVVTAAIAWLPLFGQQPAFRNAPASAAAMKNPYAHSASAAAEGQKLYVQSCAPCHGKDRQGMGPAPALDSAAVSDAKAGELFWFVTNGKPDSGMPAWSSLPKNQRWEIVSFLQSNKGVKSAAK
jgi:mono/diheme cytochrome c family protein